MSRQSFIAGIEAAALHIETVSRARWIKYGPPKPPKTPAQIAADSIRLRASLMQQMEDANPLFYEMKTRGRIR